ncbi:helix-turn-helix domain-containing protein [Frischella sp. Ac48]|uniref:helix-turn-helix domain-containing protein n=1 Tax=Frischella sp. Ac48 TaxID=2804531 RepID=UPI001C7DBE9F|nr:helix-turn-helix domain-containing protein [Frischella sp. Ac48]
MREYKQRNPKEVNQICYLKSKGLMNKVIAQILVRHISTIYRELKHNKDYYEFYYHVKPMVSLWPDEKLVVSE